MSKLNLKNNPELARQRHAEQQRAYYQRNKEYIIAMQRKRRTLKRLTFTTDIKHNERVLRNIGYKDPEEIYEMAFEMAWCEKNKELQRKIFYEL